MSQTSTPDNTNTLSSTLPENQEDMDKIFLSDEDLDLVLDALVLERDRLLLERAGPAVYVYEGERLPPADTLDGRLLRIGLLLHRLEAENVRRAVLKMREQQQST